MLFVTAITQCITAVTYFQYVPQLLRNGRKAKLADCLIAQACIDNDAPLITYDRDFRHFESAGLRVI